MKKRVCLTMASAIVALFVGASGYGLAKSGAMGVTAWEDVTLEQTYRFGDTVVIPDCELTYEGKDYLGKKIVTYPSGQVLTGDAFVASESGQYTVRYQVTVNGKILEKEISFIVMNETYTTTLKGSSVLNSIPYLSL